MGYTQKSKVYVPLHFWEAPTKKTINTVCISQKLIVSKNKQTNKKKTISCNK